MSRNTAIRLKPLGDEAIKGLKNTEGQWFQWLAATHRADQVDGMLVRRAGTDEVLAGQLTVKGRASVDGTSAPFEMRWSRKVQPVEAAQTAHFSLPKAMEPARRDRPWLMILERGWQGLADVYARRAGK